MPFPVRFCCQREWCDSLKLDRRKHYIVYHVRMDQFGYNLTQLTSLLDDGHFKLELKSYRQAFQRLKVRLRNNVLSAKFKNLVTLTRNLELNFPAQLFTNYAEKIQKSSKKGRNNAYKSLRKLIHQLIIFLDQLIEKAFHVYCYCQQHFRIGHLIHHLIFLRTSISRLRICFKALLVYACDSIIELDKDTCEEARAILIKNDCKPRPEQTNQPSPESKRSVSDDTLPEPSSKPDIEEVGVLIDRDTLKPKEKTSKRKRGNKKAL